MRLMNRCKLEKARKNWKNEETNYLFYIIDKYCILNELQPNNLKPGDW